MFEFPISKSIKLKHNSRLNCIHSPDEDGTSGKCVLFMPVFLGRLKALALLFLVLSSSGVARVADTRETDEATVKAEYANIGMGTGTIKILNNTHPDAQWFGDAGLGLFIHWGIGSVKGLNLSHPMIAHLPKGPMSEEKRRKLFSTKAYRGLNGSEWILPNRYFDLAKEFNPQKYNPDLWMKAAKDAGFTYSVFTTKHHEGFALWPSAYGEFNTKNYMGGRDLVKEWVDACRKNGIKVGLYFSGPDFYFDREYMNFLAKDGHDDWPDMDADYNPRTEKKSSEWIEEHQKAFATMLNGQVEELLTRYGKIDLIWFDGEASKWCGSNRFISIPRMRELQPGIVIIPRMHKAGDFETFERSLNLKKPVKRWGELCDTWTTTWSHVDNIPFRAPHYVLGNLTTCHSFNVNYLIGVGPTKDGEFVPEIYENIAKVGAWMKVNHEAVTKAKALPEGESASVPATTLGRTRYLFVQANNKGKYAEDLLPSTDVTLTLSGVEKPSSVILTGDSKPVEFIYADKTLTISLPAARRSTGVDVIKVELTP
jgi:alpha-L-fucosidase